MTRKDNVHGVPWFGIGLERPKTAANLGTLYRSAVCFGATFIFTIGHRYHRQASDTVKAYGHVPIFAFDDLDDFAAHRPFGARLVGVELCDDAIQLEAYSHPRQACYLLGPEDGSLSASAQALCDSVVAFRSKWCLNVASAGTVVMYDRQTKVGSR